MSNKVKDADPIPDSGVDLPFEEAMRRLEKIVDGMEHEDLPLETLLAKYEEGTRLARTCQSRLQEAEMKIQQLEKNSDGQFVLKPLSAAQEPA
jgi:exodeoxyribonuclease VII small subunit